jgi:hypothetical protein
MMLRRLWVVVTGVGFLAWLGWLAYLAATTTRPIVLSRPQFIVSELDVIAQLEEKAGRPSPRASVKQIHWPQKAADKFLDQTITVSNLPRAQGWQGPGLYILALVPDGQDYKIAPVPASPGFDPNRKAEEPRIYLWNHQTRAQLESIAKPASHSP